MFIHADKYLFAKTVQQENKELSPHLLDRNDFYVCHMSSRY